MTGRVWRLASRELAAHRVQSAVVVLAVGLMLGVLIAALAVVRGLEQLCVTAAGAATGGQVYLLSDLDTTDGDAEIAAQAQTQGGRVLSPDAAELQELGGLPAGAAGTVVALTSVADAAAYQQEMLATFGSEHYQDTELFTEQLSVYSGWRNFDADLVTPAFWVGLGATLLVATASLAFGLWLEPWPGICAEAFSGGHWLWGWDWRMFMVLILPLAATGGTLLLNLDQFFDRKLSKRIKEQL